MNWQSALDWVTSLNTTTIACTNYTAMTFTDWRLPNIRELRSLADYGEINPALPTGHPFTNVQLDFYWSSSSAVSSPGSAWNMRMRFASDDFGSKSNSFFVWPVRGEQ